MTCWNIEESESQVVQLSRIYSNLDDLFTPIHFNAANSSTLLNIIFAEVKRKRSKQSDSHNLGKTTLIALIDFLLLKDITGSDHFLTKHKDWPAPGSEDTELGVLMGPEVDHGEAEVHARVQA
jgi:hypothetical protein